MGWNEWAASWNMESLERKIGWGKYKTFLLREVIFQDPDYIIWIIRNTNINVS